MATKPEIAKHTPGACDPLDISVVEHGLGQFGLSNVEGLGWLENHDRDYFNVSGYWGQLGPYIFRAAPDMLEALEALERYLRDTPHHNAVEAAAARAAIAKARGEAA